MFDHLGWAELAVLAVLALFVFGPERLPKVAADAGRLLRQLRSMATGITDDIKAELGPEVAELDLASLHPKRFVHKHLFEEEPPSSPPGSPQRAAGASRLRPGEAPPYDPDAT